MTPTTEHGGGRQDADVASSAKRLLAGPAAGDRGRGATSLVLSSEIAEADRPLHEANSRFNNHTSPHRFMLNAVPKCGTMLLRNILAMFVPWDEIFLPFISANGQDSFKGAHPAALPERYRFICGHMHHTLWSARALRGYRMIVMIRDPRSQVLSYANFLYGSDQYKASVVARHVKDNDVTFDSAIALIIEGWSAWGEYRESVYSRFRRMAIAWMAEATLVVRYEELMSHIKDLETPEARRYFETLLKCIDLELPDDWIDRVRTGADPAISVTASVNVGNAPDRRKSMTPEQEMHLGLMAPGLRAALGYA